jgi:hypothetical protein
LPDPGTPLPLAQADSMLAADIHLAGSTVADVEIETRTWWVFYAANVTTVAMVLAILSMVYLVRAFLSSVIAGEVFTARNARRLSVLGWLLVAVGVAGPQLQRVRAAVILSHIRELGGVGARLSAADPEGGAIWLLGALVLVLAAAWRYGSELQMERDLTV